LPLVALPFLHLAPATTLAVFVGVVGVAAVLGVIGNNAWTAWMGELVPAPIRGRFFGQRMVYLSLSGTVASLAAGLALDAFGPRGWRGETLAVLAAIACIAAVVSIWLLVIQQAPRIAVEPPPARDWRTAIAPVRDAKARALLVYLFGWNAAVGLSASFFSFHMLENLKLGFGLAAAHGIAVAVVRVVSAPVWGRLVDRCGARPVLGLCSFGVASIPAIWLFATPDRLWPIAVEAVVAGALWGGHGIAAFHLSLGLSPGPRRPFCLAGFAMAGGVGFALSSTLAGVLVYTLPSRLDVLGSGWVDIHVLFVLSAIARAAAAGLALRIDEPAARSVPDLVRALIAAVPRARSAPRPGPART
jgi:MFS family permease